MIDDERSEQMFRAIRMSNRVSVAEIRLKRADKLIDSFGADIKEIGKSITSLTDSLLIGDDVKSSLDHIEKRVDALEARI